MQHIGASQDLASHNWWSYESDRHTCHTKISMTQGCLSTLLKFYSFYKLKGYKNFMVGSH